MNAKHTAEAGKSQSDKFKEAAREHGADLSVRRWEDKLRKVAKAKPEKPE